eukprot:964167_1
MKLIRIMRQRDENGKDEEDAHGVDYDTNIDVWHTQRRYRRGSLDVIHCYLCHTKWKKTNDASMIEMQKMNPKVNNSDKFVTNVMNSSEIMHNEQVSMGAFEETLIKSLKKHSVIYAA